MRLRSSKSKDWLKWRGSGSMEMKVMVVVVDANAPRAKVLRLV